MNNYQTVPMDNNCMFVFFPPAMSNHRMKTRIQISLTHVSKNPAFHRSEGQE